MNEDLKMEIMKAKILELREKSAEATIQMMQRDGKLKKRISKKEKEELKKQFMNEMGELFGNLQKNIIKKYIFQNFTIKYIFQKIKIFISKNLLKKNTG